MKQQYAIFILITFSFFFTDCQKETELLSTTDTSEIQSINRNTTLTVYDSLGLSVYERLGEFKDLANKEGQVLNFFYDQITLNNHTNTLPDKIDYLHMVKTNVEMLAYLEFEDFLQLKEEKNIITNLQKNYLLDWQNSLSQLEQTTVDRTTYLHHLDFLENELITDQKLSLKEQANLRILLISFKYGLQFLFDEGIPMPDGGIAHFRSCEVSKISQLFQGYVAIIDLFILTGQIIDADQAVFLANLESLVSNIGAFIFGVGNWVECILIVIRILPVEIISNFWCWISNNCDELDCRNPESFGITSRTGCRSADIRVFGAGDDIAFYSWTNSNAIPAAAITTDSELNLTAINPSSPVLVTVIPTCSDGDIFSPLVQVFNLDVTVIPAAPDIYINGPNHTQVYTTRSYTAEYPIHPIIELEWSVDSSIGEIVDTDKNTADIRFFRSGVAAVTATVKNTCSTLTNSFTLQVTVQ